MSSEFNYEIPVCTVVDVLELEFITDDKLRWGTLGSNFKTDLLVRRKHSGPGKGIRHLILVRDYRVGFQGFDIIGNLSPALLNFINI